jgi:hypothetical protein
MLEIILTSIIDVLKYLTSNFVDTGDVRLNGLLIALIITIMTNLFKIETYHNLQMFFGRELDLKNKNVVAYLKKKLY